MRLTSAVPPPRGIDEANIEDFTCCQPPQAFCKPEPDLQVHSIEPEFQPGIKVIGFICQHLESCNPRFAELDI